MLIKADTPAAQQAGTEATIQMKEGFDTCIPVTALRHWSEAKKIQQREFPLFSITVMELLFCYILVAIFQATGILIEHIESTETSMTLKKKYARTNGTQLKYSKQLYHTYTTYIAPLREVSEN